MLSKSYNSSFGRGWHFEYDEFISKLQSGTFVYSRGDGSAIYFEPDGKGGYTCPDGYNLTFTPVKIGEKEGDFGGEELEKYNVYEYEVKSADGEVRRFNTMGMLTRITDAKGFVTSLAYDDEYNLKSITSPAGTVYPHPPAGKNPEILFACRRGFHLHSKISVSYDLLPSFQSVHTQ